MTTINNLQTNNINAAYSNLYKAFMLRDRSLIIANCKACQYLGIPQFQEKANVEINRLYSKAGIKTKPIKTTIEELRDDVLIVYAQACLNVLWNVKMQPFGYDNPYAYQVLSQHRQFQSDDVLYQHRNDIFTVGNFLKVTKYALSIAEIIDPQNKDYPQAGASVLALQGIDSILNNKSQSELSKHTLHVATDFLASNVKESLNGTNAKRGVAITALMLNLAIDFLMK